MQHATFQAREKTTNQLTECLCPIPIITYPQDVLLAIQRVPEKKRDREEDSRNISKRFEALKEGSCWPIDLSLCRH